MKVVRYDLLIILYLHLSSLISAIPNQFATNSECLLTFISKLESVNSQSVLNCDSLGYIELVKNVYERLLFLIIYFACSNHDVKLTKMAITLMIWRRFYYAKLRITLYRSFLECMNFERSTFHRLYISVHVCSTWSFG